MYYLIFGGGKGDFTDSEKEFLNKYPRLAGKLVEGTCMVDAPKELCLGCSAMDRVSAGVPGSIVLLAIAWLLVPGCPNLDWPKLTGMIALLLKRAGTVWVHDPGWPGCGCQTFDRLPELLRHLLDNPFMVEDHRTNVLARAQGILRRYPEKQVASSEVHKWLRGLHVDFDGSTDANPRFALINDVPGKVLDRQKLPDTPACLIYDRQEMGVIIDYLAKDSNATAIWRSALDSLVQAFWSLTLNKAIPIITLRWSD